MAATNQDEFSAFIWNLNEVNTCFFENNVGMRFEAGFQKINDDNKTDAPLFDKRPKLYPLYDTRILAIAENCPHFVSPNMILSSRFEKYDEDDGFLDLSNCLLDSLPDELWALRNLNTLSLSDNNLADLDPRIFQIDSLQHLIFNNNEISQIPAEIANLHQLSELCCKGNQITSLPDSICNLGKLNLLVLSNNKICELPTSFGALKSLRYFSCKSNSLSNIPESVKHMRSLLEINLSGNRLEAFPTFLLKATNVFTIILSNNAIRDLPRDLNKLLPRRIDLWLDGNPIDQDAVGRLRLKPGSHLTVDKGQNEFISEVARETLEITVYDDEKRYVFDPIQRTTVPVGEPIDFGQLEPRFSKMREVDMGSRYRAAELQLVGDWVPELPDFMWQDKSGETEDGRFLILIAWDLEGIEYGFRVVMIDKFERKTRVSPRVEGACKEVSGFSLVVERTGLYAGYRDWEVLA